MVKNGQKRLSRSLQTPFFDVFHDPGFLSFGKSNKNKSGVRGLSRRGGVSVVRTVYQTKSDPATRNPQTSVVVSCSRRTFRRSGGPPFFGNFENCQKCQKYVSRAPPGGAGRHFSDILDSGRSDPGCRGGGRGGTPPWRRKPMSNLPSGFTGPSRSTMALVTLTRTN